MEENLHSSLKSPVAFNSFLFSIEANPYFGF